ncbi:MAG TPA: aldehyde ferredoxin oxidoreductase N-terminal domain-containing protein, partial [Anaerolineae bacterium]
MNGWTGTILRVNLTTRAVKREPLDPRLARLYIGGRGLGARYLTDEVDPQVDPLGPDNKLIFASGPLTGTFAPSSGRYMVITKAPLNNVLASSNSGGHFGPELKFAGYDMLIVEGRAEQPVYLWIKDDQVEIREARHLWGKTVPDVTDALRAETDEDARVACIGPAGEKLVLFASIMNDMQRAAGRSGVGAVMGSKNLKAVAVLGSGSVKVADRDVFLAAVLKARRLIHEHPVGGAGLKAYGTDVLVNILNEVGGLPANNFRTGYFAAANNPGGETLTAKYLTRPGGC